MRETITCSQCHEPFTLSRNLKNRNAAIRFCDKCKDEINYYRQNERPQYRAVSTSPARGSRRVYLASN